MLILIVVLFFEKEHEISLSCDQLAQGVNTSHDRSELLVQLPGKTLNNSKLAIGKCKGKLGLTKKPGSLLEGKQSNQKSK